jgi:taurine--2-oxoglutarate transaminase
VQQIRELTTRLGILWIDDEIITGFGRTGKWFAYQWSGVTPDIMTIGKAFTNATIPMSATIVSKRSPTTSPATAGWSAAPTRVTPSPLRQR